MLQYLLNPLFSGIICGIIAVLLFKLDSKITGVKKSKLEYFKIFVVNSLITGLLVYVIGMYNDYLELNPTITPNPVKSVKNPVPATPNLDSDIAPF